jgi:hypothetical protein
MAARGVHFALTAEDEQKLRVCPEAGRSVIFTTDQ